MADDDFCDDFGFSSGFREEHEDGEHQDQDPVDFVTDLAPLETDENNQIKKPVPETEEIENEKKDDELADVVAEAKTKRKIGARLGILTVDKLIRKNGLPELLNVFDGVKFRGRGHEIEDLNMMMAKLEQWAHRLCPKMPFDEALEKIEVLGTKRPVQTALTRLRHGDSVQDNETGETAMEPEGVTNFIHSGSKDGIVDYVDPFDRYVARPQESQTIDLTEEQRRRIEENKRKARERLLAKESQAMVDDDLDAILGNLAPDFENTQRHKSISSSEPPAAKKPNKPLQYADDMDFVDEETFVEEEDEWFSMAN